LLFNLINDKIHISFDKEIFMSKGGKREGSGRKKIGMTLNTRVEYKIIEEIDKFVNGDSRAEKIRKCLDIGLKIVKEENDKYE
jgi:hypothetical protein